LLQKLFAVYLVGLTVYKCRSESTA